jgi:integrase
LSALWTVALAIGLRKGEALGLHWSDVDLDRGKLRVRTTLQRVEGRLQLSEPKTGRSKRTIPLPPVCIEALKRQAERQEEERQAAGSSWHESGLVFTTTIGTPIEPRNVNRWFAQLCKRAGVRTIRMHDLRHTCASILLAQGVPLRVVMEILGHSQIAVTADLFTHVLPALNEDAARRMQEALSPVAVNAAVIPSGATPGTSSEPT